jgi:type IV secretion system protein VirB9
MIALLSALTIASALLAEPPDSLLDDLERSAAAPISIAAAPIPEAPEAPASASSPALPPKSRTDALETYRDTGIAPVLYQTNEIIHPWGQSVPTLTCAPLNVCAIHLEPGEEIRDIAAGDPVRWQIATATSGEPATPHVVVKPTELDLATNLFVTTQRRTYSIELRSPSRVETKKPGFKVDRSLSFYYPEDFVRRLKAQEAVSRSTTEASERLTLAELSTDLSGLNFDYRISPARAKRPLRVFDDGKRTYIQLRNPGETGDAPALLALSPRGKTLAINFRPSPDGSWYIADGIFARLQLVTRAGRYDQKVTIVNRHLGGQR